MATEANEHGVCLIGLNRTALLSQVWHEHHLHATKYLTGFQSFVELRLYAASFFPEEFDKVRGIT